MHAYIHIYIAASIHQQATNNSRTWADRSARAHEGKHLLGRAKGEKAYLESSSNVDAVDRQCLRLAVVEF
jgi:hypothetical protein